MNISSFAYLIFAPLCLSDLFNQSLPIVEFANMRNCIFVHTKRF